VATGGLTALGLIAGRSTAQAKARLGTAAFGLTMAAQSTARASARAAQSVSVSLLAARSTARAQSQAALTQIVVTFTAVAGRSLAAMQAAGRLGIPGILVGRSVSAFFMRAAASISVVTGGLVRRRVDLIGRKADPSLTGEVDSANLVGRISQDGLSGEKSATELEGRKD
jgi:hypothetical protein